MNSYISTRITDKIVADVEQGVRSWLKPWNVEHAAGRVTRTLRFNGTRYNGINVLMLWASAVERGFAAPIWMTFKQTKVLDAHVRKGEKGSLVVYANTITRNETDPETGEDHVAYSRLVAQGAQRGQARSSPPPRTRRGPPTISSACNLTKTGPPLEAARPLPYRADPAPGRALAGPSAPALRAAPGPHPSDPCPLGKSHDTREIAGTSTSPHLHMHTIAVLSQTGGTGKTTLALNLAIAAETAAYSAVVVDLDPQASAKGWHDNRTAESPVVISVQAARLAGALGTAEAHGAKVAVIDTAPHSESAALAAARARARIGGRPSMLNEKDPVTGLALLPYPSIPVKEVASHLGISVSSLYQYFSGARSGANCEQG